MIKRLYGAFSYLGLMSVAAAFITGFRHDASAPVGNLIFDVALYAVFIAVHIVMTMPAFKRAVFGRPEGVPVERRIYIVVSVLTWLGVFWLHEPVPGLAFTSPAWLQFVGLCAVLLSMLAVFEDANMESLGSLLGVPGSPLSHSVGAETPLMTEGSYASVRHPMYRGFVFLALSSLLIHPHAGQLLFAAMLIASFVSFVPFEERQLLAARGDEYRGYMRATPYRIMRGVW